MDFTISALARFSASHIQSGCPLGERLHGHRYLVVVECRRRFDPIKGYLHPPPSDLGPALEAVVGELDGEHLNEMMPGTHTLSENIGAWIMERLSLQFKQLTTVTVDMDDGVVVTVRREVRA